MLRKIPCEGHSAYQHVLGWLSLHHAQDSQPLVSRTVVYDGGREPYVILRAWNFDRCATRPWDHLHESAMSEALLHQAHAQHRPHLPRVPFFGLVLPEAGLCNLQLLLLLDGSFVIYGIVCRAVHMECPWPTSCLRSACPSHISLSSSELGNIDFHARC